jgi:hypothetical protein
MLGQADKTEAERAMAASIKTFRQDFLRLGPERAFCPIEQISARLNATARSGRPRTGTCS